MAPEQLLQSVGIIINAGISNRIINQVVILIKLPEIDFTIYQIPENITLAAFQCVQFPQIKSGIENLPTFKNCIHHLIAQKCVIFAKKFCE